MDFGLVAQTNAPARDVVALAQRAEDAGFTHFRRAAETPFNIVYEIKP